MHSLLGMVVEAQRKRHASFVTTLHLKNGTPRRYLARLVTTLHLKRIPMHFEYIFRFCSS